MVEERRMEEEGKRSQKKARRIRRYRSADVGRRLVEAAARVLLLVLREQRSLDGAIMLLARLG